MRTLKDLAAKTPDEYRKPDVRSFMMSISRAYYEMKRQQCCTRVLLQIEWFGITEYDQFAVTCPVVQDSSSPRIYCQNRTMVIRPIREGLTGVCPEAHGGPWLSRRLIYHFICPDENLSQSKYQCKHLLTGKKCHAGCKVSKKNPPMPELPSWAIDLVKGYDELLLCTGGA